MALGLTSHPRRSGRRTIEVGVAAAGLALFGAALAFAGSILHPVAMVAAPVAILLAPAVLVDPKRAIIALFLSLPVGLAPLVPGIQVVEVAVTLAIVAVMLTRINRGLSPLGWHPLCWWVVFFLAVTAVATAGALDPGRAIRQELLLIAGAALALTIVSVATTTDELRRLVGPLVVVGGLMCIYGVITSGDLSAAYGGAVVHNRAQGLFKQPNELGAFAGITLLVSTGYMLGARTSPTRAAGGIAIAAALGALTLSLSRGAWLGTALGLLGLVLVVKRARTWLPILAIPLLLSAVLLGAARPDAPQVEVVRARLSTFGEPATSNPYDERPSIYAEGVRQATTTPWFGVGPGNFPVAAARPASETRTVGPEHAHNVLLTVAAEVGMPATVLLVGFSAHLGAMLVRSIHRLGASDQALVGGLAGALLVIMGQGIVDYAMRNPVVFMTVWSVVGLALVGASASVTRGSWHGRTVHRGGSGSRSPAMRAL